MFICEVTTPLEKILDPALMTFDEYATEVNKNNKFHDSTVYDISVKDLSKYITKEKFPILIRRYKINGINFELRMNKTDNYEKTYYKVDKNGNYIRINGNLVPYTREEIAMMDKRRFEYEWAFFHDDDAVGVVHDEWGAVLVRVADEYRGFGLGPILIKAAREEYPLKSSGGFTASGYKNLRKVHAWFVSDYLSRGWYSELIRRGTLTTKRAMEIIKSTKLDFYKQRLIDAGIDPNSEYFKASIPNLKFRPKNNMDLSNDPKDWLIYTNGYGIFVLYNKKLLELYKEGYDFEHFQNNYIIGIIELIPLKDKDWELKSKYGPEKITNFLTNVAAGYIDNEGEKLINIDYEIIHPNILDADKKFRKDNDPYREFENQLLDHAYQLLREKHD